MKMTVLEDAPHDDPDASDLRAESDGHGTPSESRCDGCCPDAVISPFHGIPAENPPPTRHFRPSPWRAVFPSERMLSLECHCEYHEGASPPFRAWSRLNAGSEGYGTGLARQEAEAEAAWDWYRRWGDGVSLRYVTTVAPSSNTIVAHTQPASRSANSENDR